MPCYLFTYHAYGSWLPDHPRGYVKRNQGIQPTDQRAAAMYGENLKHRVPVLDETVQRCLIEAMVEAAGCQDCRMHYAATETTHIHALVSWRSDRDWKIVRRQLRHKATVDLNAMFERREWFAKSPSRRRVEDRSHFQHLITTYLPRHRGLKWCEGKGIIM